MNLDKIRPSVKYVVDNAKNVKINYQEIDKFCDSFNVVEVKHWFKLIPINLELFSKEEQIKFFILVDSINFSFWGEPKWEYYFENKTYSGSLAMVISIYAAVMKDKTLLNSNRLLNLTIDDVNKIFIKDKNNITIPLIKERLHNMQDIGYGLTRLEKENSNLLTIFDNIKDGKEAFTFISKYFKSYKNDYIKYKGKTIYFYKRLQLLISDISESVYDNKKFSLNPLTLFADYKIPQLMRALNFMTYSDKLSKIVDNKLEIKAGSVYETEIRASIVYIAHYIKLKLKERNIIVNEAYIDSYMFYLIKTNKDLIIKPHHQVRTTNY